jgi:hypothetical protein
MRSATTLGRHVRRPLEQPDLVLDAVDGRAPRRAPVGRRAIGPHRLSHGVARQPQSPSDRLDAQLFREVQPPDLCPLVHVVHVLPPELASSDEPRLDVSPLQVVDPLGRGVSFRPLIGGTVFSCWRHEHLACDPRQPTELSPLSGTSDYWDAACQRRRADRRRSVAATGRTFWLAALANADCGGTKPRCSGFVLG